MTRIHFSALLLALLTTVFASTAVAQYRWVDANGKVFYGDVPPRDARDVKPLSTRTTPLPAGSDGSTNLPFEVRRAMDRAPVVLYTSPECQPCAPAVALLRERGVPFVERTVISPDDLQEFRRISGGLRLPHISVGSQVQNGFSPDLWTALLDAAGYPKGSMLPRGYQWPAPQSLVAPVKPEARAAEPPAAESPAAPERARR